ncbi:hypothetical protein M408DRAFT_27885 [Serendipita vermifera MAFF 305830]|uniref:Uncharacterized protein n=1 Tax=Serendipita vermifera MAFF 305830 TaxID=933852 RepID=A0A0C3ATU7_SERVB|nr:hypothetical protein M408DRAFT_27885 [Serendipita vermifera MAFF 305830]
MLADPGSHSIIDPLRTFQLSTAWICFNRVEFRPKTHRLEDDTPTLPPRWGFWEEEVAEELDVDSVERKEDGSSGYSNNGDEDNSEEGDEDKERALREEKPVLQDLEASASSPILREIPSSQS